MPELAHVLVVEQDADVRSLIAEVVREAGYSVTEVSTLPAALHALLVSDQPQVVVLDMQMPDDFLTSGVMPLTGEFQPSELLVVMADEGVLHGHTFVLLTSDSLFWLPPSLLRLRSKMALSVVTMPIDVDDLLHAVKQAAERLRRLASDAGGDAEGEGATGTGPAGAS